MQHTLIVYAGGHGSTDGQNQIYLLNSSDHASFFFPIEQELRRMVEEFELLRVFAIYNCDRVVAILPGLITLSDLTEVDGRAWSELKKSAMKPGFLRSKAVQKYDRVETAILQSLINAQKTQGNLNALEIQLSSP